MIKKEVICYSGFSMGGFEACELLENNKARINSLETSAEIIEIKEYKILTFWDKIDGKKRRSDFPSYPLGATRAT